MAPVKKPFCIYSRSRKKNKPIYYVKFKKPDGTWGTGKCAGTTSRAKAELWAYDYLQHGQIVQNEKTTLKEFSKDFFSWEGPWATEKRAIGKRIGRRHCKEREFVLNKHVIPALGDMRLIDITRAAIKEFRNSMLKKEYAGSTINKALSILKCLLEAAEEKEFLRYVPKIDRAADRPEKSRGILKQEEVRKLFNVQWGDFRAYVMNLLAATSGLRLGELQALTLKDINLDERYIIVSRSWDRKVSIMNETTKTGRTRTVIIPPVVCNEISRLIELNPWEKDDSFIFFSIKTDKKPVSENIIKLYLCRALNEIGITEKDRKERNLTFHSWRHWFNSILINSRIPLQKIQSLTGHSTDKMSNHYYHMDDMGDVVQALQDTLFSDMPGDGTIN